MDWKTKHLYQYSDLIEKFNIKNEKEIGKNIIFKNKLEIVYPTGEKLDILKKEITIKDIIDNHIKSEYKKYYIRNIYFNKKVENNILLKLSK